MLFFHKEQAPGKAISNSRNLVEDRVVSLKDGVMPLAQTVVVPGSEQYILVSFSVSGN